MGGSSLAPDVMRRTFGAHRRFPAPARPRLERPGADQGPRRPSRPERRRSSSSPRRAGPRPNREAFLRYFYDRVAKTVGTTGTGEHFIAITDREDAAAGGSAGRPASCGRSPTIRTSAAATRRCPISGWCPAAIAGYDVRLLIDRGIGGLMSNARTTRSAQGRRRPLRRRDGGAGEGRPRQADDRHATRWSNRSGPGRNS